MSVNFMWEVVKPTKAKCFAAGTSSDDPILRETFGDIISSDCIPVLRAMHRTSGLGKSLWSEIADTLERLHEDDADSVKIKVWPQY